jgi:hypothetical protein
MNNWQLPAWAMQGWMSRLAQVAIRSAEGNNSIRIGARLRQIPAQYEWEVVARFQDHDGIPHARFRKLNDRGTTKVLACTALLNRRRFRVSM